MSVSGFDGQQWWWIPPGDNMRKQRLKMNILPCGKCEFRGSPVKLSQHYQFYRDHAGPRSKWYTGDKPDKRLLARWLKAGFKPAVPAFPKPDIEWINPTQGPTIRSYKLNYCPSCGYELKGTND